MSPRPAGSAPSRRGCRGICARRRKAKIRSLQHGGNQAARYAALLAVEPSSTLVFSEFLSPAYRVASKDTCVGGCGAISPPIAPPPPQRPPLGLLPAHAGPGSEELPALTTRRWGASCIDGLYIFGWIIYIVQARSSLHVSIRADSIEPYFYTFGVCASCGLTEKLCFFYAVGQADDLDKDYICAICLQWSFRFAEHV